MGHFKLFEQYTGESVEAVNEKISMADAREIAHKVLTKLIDIGLFSAKKKDYELVSRVAGVVLSAVNESSVTEAGDHEVGMAQGQLDTIIKMAQELKAKIGTVEKDIPGWIQDHISKSEDYILQASNNYHEVTESMQLNEMDLNDPVLIALRASKISRGKKQQEEVERKKKRVYGKQREKIEDDLWSINQDLKDAYAEKRDIYREQDAEAGEKGNDWTDTDANRYGDMLNKVDDQIEKLITKRNELEIKLAY